MNANATLSRRETEIAELIAWGGAKKEIADRLCRSTRTIENTARNIYKKVGISKSSELSVWWFCTHFDISFSLSPLKRSMVAVALLLIFIPYELCFHQITVRSMRTRTEYSSAKARRKDDSNYLIEL